MRNDIQINKKLMEREDRLLEIFDLERQVNLILGGGPYPFDPPGDIPSLRKRKTAKRKTAGKPGADPVRLRRLESETESAYRIIYRQDGIEHSEIHLDPKPLTLLANTPLPRVEVRRIETVRKNPNGEWDGAEILYEAEQPSATC